MAANMTRWMAQSANSQRRRKKLLFAGCRISVALTSRGNDLQTLMNPEAKPFVSKHLQTLFDRQPMSYFALKPPMERMFAARSGQPFLLYFPSPIAHAAAQDYQLLIVSLVCSELVNNVCSWQPANPAGLVPPPPAFTNLGASGMLRKPAVMLRQGADQTPCALAKKALKYARLLQVEEAAMEDQIRRSSILAVPHCT